MRLKLPPAPRCFDHSPAMLLFTNPTCSHQGDTEAFRTHTGLSPSDLQTPLLCSAARIRGGFFSSRKKQSTSTLHAFCQTRRVSPQEQSHKVLPFSFSTPSNRNNELHKQMASNKTTGGKSDWELYSPSQISKNPQGVLESLTCCLAYDLFLA